MHLRGMSRLFGAIVILFALFATSVRAQQPETTETFVYGVNATTPGEVFANLSPPQVDEIYILANQLSVLSPKRTMLLFWPLTNRYQAQWSALNEPLDGVLEVMQDGRLINTVNISTYTVHYVIAGSTQGELFIDQDAQDADDRYYIDLANYNQAINTFRRERLRWLTEAREALIAGEEIQLRAEPERPATFTTLSVGLHQGFPLLLEAGEYRIQMRSFEGEVFPGSQRIVHVFESRQTALGFEVIPEARWTRPDQVNGASEAILAEPGSVIYLSPRLVHQYPALAMERLRDPQFSGETDGQWNWLPDFAQIDIPHDVIEIVRRNDVVERVSLDAYSVRFAFDRDLGYEILPYDEETPRLTPNIDFSGYRIQLEDGMDSFSIRLGPEAALPYQGIERQVWVIPADLSPFLIPAGIILITFLVTVWLLYRRVVRQARSGA